MKEEKRLTPTATESIEITEADRHAAKTELRRSLGITEEELIDDLPSILRKKTKEMPRYQEIIDKLKNSDRKSAVYDLFKMIRQSADGDKYPPTEDDGVRMDTMKKGRFACAGRTLVSSTALNEIGINHVVTNAPKHSFLVAEIDEDTLAYIDPMQNLYFTMPKEAIGFRGFDVVAEYTIGDFVPRDKDVFDGLSPAYRQFLAMPADMGISNQYLMNIGAVLNGNSEFNGSDTCPPVNEGGARAATAMAQELGGEHSELIKSYTDKMEKVAIVHDIETKAVEKLVAKLVKRSLDEDDFVIKASNALRGQLGNIVPYLKNANKEVKDTVLRQYYQSVS